MQWNLNGQTPSAKKRNNLFNSTEYLPSSIDSNAGQLYSGSSENLSFIEKQAELRSLQRRSRKMHRDGQESFNYELQTNGLSDIENYTNDNYASLWFGRQGGGAPIDDKRRQKLMMRLEDRSPNGYTNGAIKKVYPVDPLQLKRLPHERFFEP